jgi:hypothetical protein
MSQPNPFSIELNHRAPTSKAAILRGRAIVGMAWNESGKISTNLIKSLGQEEREQIESLVKGWAKA